MYFLFGAHPKIMHTAICVTINKYDVTYVTRAILTKHLKIVCRDRDGKG